MDLHKKTPGRVSLEIKIKRAIWNVVATILFRPFITGAFRLWRIALLKMFGAKVAWDANVYASVKIWAPWKLKMGHRACLGPNVICYNQDWIILEDDAVVSQYSYLCTASHDITNKENPLKTAPIMIHSFAWVAADAFVGMGVTIGEGSVVGARAAVFKDVEPWTVVGGNPARFIKRREIRE